LIDYLRQLDEQIFELQETLNLLGDAVLKQRHSLEQVTNQLRTSLQSSDSQTQLHLLPQILQGISENQKLGALLIGRNGSCLMSNSVAESILGNRWIRNPIAFSSEELAFYFADRETLCEQASLPWQQCALGAETQEVLLYLRRAEVRSGLWLRTMTMPLKDETNTPSGAVAFMLDVTEHIQVEEQIKQLLLALEQQLSSLQMAQRMLSRLSSKLTTASRGHEHNWTEDICGSALKSFGESAGQLRENPNFRESFKTEPESEKRIEATEKGETSDASLEASKSLVETSAAEAVENIENENNQRGCILIVDDIPVNQKLLRHQLRRLGFDADTAANGREAVDAVLEKEYALIFMDLDMPIMNGPSAARAIRSIGSLHGSQVPIVAITSYDRDAERAICSDSGMNDYLLKGATQTQLSEVVQKFLPKTQDPSFEECTQNKRGEENDSTVNIDFLVKMLGKDELEEVFRLFNSSIKAFISCMRLAIDERNNDAFCHFAHCIKGPSSAMGLTGLTSVITLMIDAAEVGDWAHVDYLYLNLRANIRRVLDQMENASQPIGR